MSKVDISEKGRREKKRMRERSTGKGEGVREFLIKGKFKGLKI